MAGLGTGAPIVKVYHEKSMILPDVSRVLACLYEKDIEFERHTASYKSLLRLQASSHAPVPFYDGLTFLEDSREICRYIAETYEHRGDPFLFGKDSLERASIEQWLHNEEHAFNPPSRSLFCHLAFPLTEEDDDIDLQKIKLEEVLEVYEQRLGDTEFLAGNKFTLADLVHLPNSHYITESDKFAYLYDSRKNVQRWWNTISTRKSWQNVLKDIQVVEQQRKQEEFEKQQRRQWLREHPPPTRRQIRLDSRKQTRTKSQTILVPPPAGIISTSPTASQAEKSLPTETSPDETLLSTPTAHKSSSVQSKQTTVFNTHQETPAATVQSTPRLPGYPHIPVESTSNSFTPATSPTTVENLSRTGDDMPDNTATNADTQDKKSVRYTGHTLQRPVEPIYGGSNDQGATYTSPGKHGSTEAHQKLQAEKWHGTAAGLSNLKGETDYSVPTQQVKPGKDVRHSSSQDSEEVNTHPLAQEPVSMDSQLVQGPEMKTREPYTDQKRDVSSMPWRQAADVRGVAEEDKASYDHRDAVLPPYAQKHAAEAKIVSADQRNDPSLSKRVNEEDTQAKPFQTVYDDPHGITQEARETAPAPRRRRAQDAYDTSEVIETYHSSSSRAQPINAPQDAPPPPKQAASEVPRRVTTPYQPAQEFIKQARESPASRSIAPRDAQGNNEEGTVESSSSKAHLLNSRLADARPPKKILDEDQKRYPDVRGTTKKSQVTFEETKNPDSASSRVQPLDSQRDYAPSWKQEAKEAPRATTPFRKRDYDVEETAKHSDGAFKPRQMVGQDTQGTYEEAKASDSVLPREQSSDTWHAATTPTEQVATEDGPRGTPPPERNAPNDEDSTMRPRGTSSAPRRTTSGDASGAFEESKPADSVSSREQPFRARQPVVTPRQETEDSLSKISAFHKTRPFVEDSTGPAVDTVFGPRQIGAEDTKYITEETKVADSASSVRARPTDTPRIARPLSEQAKVEVDAWDKDRQGRETISAPNKMVSRDGKHTYGESKIPHSASRDQSLDNLQASSPLKQAAAEDPRVVSRGAKESLVDETKHSQGVKGASNKSVGIFEETKDPTSALPTAQPLSAQDVQRTHKSSRTPPAGQPKYASTPQKGLGSSPSRAEAGDEDQAIKESRSASSKEQPADSRSPTKVERTPSVYQEDHLVAPDSREQPQILTTGVRADRSTPKLQQAPVVPPPTPPRANIYDDQEPFKRDTVDNPKRASGTFQESKPADSVSSREQDSSARQPVVTPSRQETEDPLSKISAFHKTRPFVEDITRPAVDTVSGPRRVGAEDTKDFTEETNVADSASSVRARPTYNPRTARPLSEQVELEEDAREKDREGRQTISVPKNTVSRDAQDTYGERKTPQSRSTEQSFDNMQATSPIKQEAAEDPHGASRGAKESLIDETKHSQGVRGASKKSADTFEENKDPASALPTSQPLSSQDAQHSYGSSRTPTADQRKDASTPQKGLGSSASHAEAGDEDQAIMDENVFSSKGQPADSRSPTKVERTPEDHLVAPDSREQPKIPTTGVRADRSKPKSQQAPVGTPPTPPRANIYDDQEPFKRDAVDDPKDASGTFHVSKPADSVPSREQALSAQQPVVTPSRQGTEDPLSKISAFHKTRPFVEDITGPAVGTVSGPRQTGAEDTKDITQETKVADFASSVRARPIYTPQTARPLSEQAEVEEDAREKDREGRQTISVPKSTVSRDAQDTYGERKTPNSRSTEKSLDNLQASSPIKKAATEDPRGATRDDKESLVDKPKKYQAAKGPVSTLPTAQPLSTQDGQRTDRSSRTPTADQWKDGSAEPQSNNQDTYKEAWSSPARQKGLGSSPSQAEAGDDDQAIIDEKVFPSEQLRKMPKESRSASSKEQPADSRSPTKVERTPSVYQEDHLVTPDSHEQPKTPPTGVREDGSTPKRQQVPVVPSTSEDKSTPPTPPRAKVHDDLTAEEPFKRDIVDDPKGAPLPLGQEPTSQVQRATKLTPDGDMSSKPSTIDQWQRTSAPMQGLTATSGNDVPDVSTIDQNPTPMSQQPIPSARGANEMVKREQRRAPSALAGAQPPDVQHTPPSFAGADMDERDGEPVQMQEQNLHARPTSVPTRRETPDARDTGDNEFADASDAQRWKALKAKHDAGMISEDVPDASLSTHDATGEKAPRHASEAQVSDTLPNSTAAPVNVRPTSGDELVERFPRDQGAIPPESTQAQTPFDAPRDSISTQGVPSDALDKTKFAKPSSTEGMTPTAGPASALEAQPAEHKFAPSDKKSARAARPLSSGESRKKDTGVPAADQTKKPPAIFRQQSMPSTPITKHVPSSNAGHDKRKIQQLTLDNLPTDDSPTPVIPSYEQVSRAPQTVPSERDMTPAPGTSDSPALNTQIASAKFQEAIPDSYRPDKSTVPFVSSEKQGSYYVPHEGPSHDAADDKDITKYPSKQAPVLEYRPDSTSADSYAHPTSGDELGISPDQGAESPTAAQATNTENRRNEVFPAEKKFAPSDQDLVHSVQQPFPDETRRGKTAVAAAEQTLPTNIGQQNTQDMREAPTSDFVPAEDIPSDPQSGRPDEVALAGQKFASSDQDTPLTSSVEPRNEEMRNSTRSAQPLFPAADDHTKDPQNTNIGQQDVKSTVPFVSSEKQGSYSEPHEGPSHDAHGAADDKDITKYPSKQAPVLEYRPDPTLADYVSPTSGGKPELPDQGAESPTSAQATNSDHQRNEVFPAEKKFAPTDKDSVHSVQQPSPAEIRKGETIVAAAEQTLPTISQQHTQDMREAPDSDFVPAEDMASDPRSDRPDEVPLVEQKFVSSDQDTPLTSSVEPRNEEIRNPTRSAQPFFSAADDQTNDPQKTTIGQQDVAPTPGTPKSSSSDADHASGKLQEVAPDDHQAKPSFLSDGPTRDSDTDLDKKTTELPSSHAQSSDPKPDPTQNLSDEPPTRFLPSQLPKQRAETRALLPLVGPYDSSQDVTSDTLGKANSLKPSSIDQDTPLTSSVEPRNEEIRNPTWSAQPFFSAADDQTNDPQNTTIGQQDVAPTPGTPKSSSSDADHASGQLQEVAPDDRQAKPSFVSDGPTRDFDTDLDKKTTKLPSSHAQSSDPKPDPTQNLSDEPPTRFLPSQLPKQRAETQALLPRVGPYDSSQDVTSDTLGKTNSLKSSSIDQETRGSALTPDTHLGSAPREVAPTGEKLPLKDQDSTHPTRKSSLSEPTREDFIVAAPKEAKMSPTIFTPAQTKMKDPSSGSQYVSQRLQDITPEDQQRGATPENQEQVNAGNAFEQREGRTAYVRGAVDGKMTVPSSQAENSDIAPDSAPISGDAHRTSVDGPTTSSHDSEAQPPAGTQIVPPLFLEKIESPTPSSSHQELMTPMSNSASAPEAPQDQDLTTSQLSPSVVSRKDVADQTNVLQAGLREPASSDGPATSTSRDSLSQPPAGTLNVPAVYLEKIELPRLPSTDQELVAPMTSPAPAPDAPQDKDSTQSPQLSPSVVSRKDVADANQTDVPQAGLRVPGSLDATLPSEKIQEFSPDASPTKSAKPLLPMTGTDSVQPPQEASFVYPAVGQPENSAVKRPLSRDSTQSIRDNEKQIEETEAQENGSYEPKTIRPDKAPISGDARPTSDDGAATRSLPDSRAQPPAGTLSVPAVFLGNIESPTPPSTDQEPMAARTSPAPAPDAPQDKDSAQSPQLSPSVVSRKDVADTDQTNVPQAGLREAATSDATSPSKEFSPDAYLSKSAKPLLHMTDESLPKSVDVNPSSGKQSTTRLLRGQGAQRPALTRSPLLHESNEDVPESSADQEATSPKVVPASVPDTKLGTTSDDIAPSEKDIPQAGPRVSGSSDATLPSEKEFSPDASLSKSVKPLLPMTGTDPVPPPQEASFAYPAVGQPENSAGKRPLYEEPVPLFSQKNLERTLPEEISKQQQQTDQSRTRSSKVDSIEASGITSPNILTTSGDVQPSPPKESMQAAQGSRSEQQAGQAVFQSTRDNEKQVEETGAQENQSHEPKKIRPDSAPISGDARPTSDNGPATSSLHDSREQPPAETLSVPAVFLENIESPTPPYTDQEPMASMTSPTPAPDAPQDKDSAQSSQLSPSPVSRKDVADADQTNVPQAGLREAGSSDARRPSEEFSTDAYLTKSAKPLLHMTDESPPKSVDVNPSSGQQSTTGTIRGPGAQRPALTRSPLLHESNEDVPESSADQEATSPNVVPASAPDPILGTASDEIAPDGKNFPLPARDLARSAKRSFSVEPTEEKGSSAQTSEAQTIIGQREVTPTDKREGPTRDAHGAADKKMPLPSSQAENSDVAPDSAPINGDGPTTSSFRDLEAQPPTGTQNVPAVFLEKNESPTPPFTDQELMKPMTTPAPAPDAQKDQDLTTSQLSPSVVSRKDVADQTSASQAGLREPTSSDSTRPSEKMLSADSYLTKSEKSLIPMKGADPVQTPYEASSDLSSDEKTTMIKGDQANTISNVSLSASQAVGQPGNSAGKGPLSEESVSPFSQKNLERTPPEEKSKQQQPSTRSSKDDSIEARRTANPNILTRSGNILQSPAKEGMQEAQGLRNQQQADQAVFQSRQDNKKQIQETEAEDNGSDGPEEIRTDSAPISGTSSDALATSSLPYSPSQAPAGTLDVPPVFLENIEPTPRRPSTDQELITSPEPTPDTPQDEDSTQSGQLSPSVVSRKGVADANQTDVPEAGLRVAGSSDATLPSKKIQEFSPDASLNKSAKPLLPMTGTYPVQPPQEASFVYPAVSQSENSTVKRPPSEESVSLGSQKNLEGTLSEEKSKKQQQTGQSSTRSSNDDSLEASGTENTNIRKTRDSQPSPLKATEGSRNQEQTDQVVFQSTQDNRKQIQENEAQDSGSDGPEKIRPDSAPISGDARRTSGDGSATGSLRDSQEQPPAGTLNVPAVFLENIESPRPPSTDQQPMTSPSAVSRKDVANADQASQAVGQSENSAVKGPLSEDVVSPFSQKSLKGTSPEEKTKQQKQTGQSNTRSPKDDSIVEARGTTSPDVSTSGDRQPSPLKESTPAAEGSSKQQQADQAAFEEAEARFIGSDEPYETNLQQNTSQQKNGASQRDAFEQPEDIVKPTEDARADNKSESSLRTSKESKQQVETEGKTQGGETKAPPVSEAELPEERDLPSTNKGTASPSQAETTYKPQEQTSSGTQDSEANSSKLDGSTDGAKPADTDGR